MQLPVRIIVRQSKGIPAVRINVECDCTYPFETLIHPFIRVANVAEEMEAMFVNQDFENEDSKNNSVRFTVVFSNMEKSNKFCSILSLGGF